MKKSLYSFIIALLASSSAPGAPSPLGTAFTYQGQLVNGGSPANGNYDLCFKLYDDPATGSEIATPVLVAGEAVSNGVFTVTLDFGTGAFTGGARWLELQVRTNDPSASYIVLAPRQAVTPAPVALWTPQAATAGLASNVVTGTITAPHLGTPSTPNAGQLLSYSGTSLAWTTPPGGWGPSWLLGGNAGTTPGVNFLGTTDLEPLQLRVNGTLGLCLQPTPAGGVSLVGGQGSTIAASVDYGTIGGGFANSLLDSAHGATIAGGNQNKIGANAQLAAIGGGGGNTISSNSWFSTIFGGQANAIGAGVGGGVIAGGSFNTLGDGASSSGISGGGANTIGAGGAYDTIGGGAGNQVAPGAWYAVVAGGMDNVASNSWATVGGGENNAAFGAASTIAGGNGNVVTNAGDTIGGGTGNLATGGNSTIGGGQINLAQGPNSTVGGGYQNWALASASTVGGGGANSAYGDYSTLGGGYGNIAQGYCATVPGGYTNKANGAYSFAAGRRAKALADGTFVWADTTDTDFISSVTNQFAVRATGGMLVNAGTNNFEIASGGIKVTGAGVDTGTPVFIHKATAGNLNGFYTTITNPHTDGNPGALLFVAHNWNQDTMSETHPVGVFYSSGHWAIYHEDGAAMPVGAAFNVIVIKP